MIRTPSESSKAPIVCPGAVLEYGDECEIVSLFLGKNQKYSITFPAVVQKGSEKSSIKIRVRYGNGSVDATLSLTDIFRQIVRAYDYEAHDGLPCVTKRSFVKAVLHSSLGRKKTTIIVDLLKAVLFDGRYIRDSGPVSLHLHPFNIPYILSIRGAVVFGGIREIALTPCRQRVPSEAKMVQYVPQLTYPDAITSGTIGTAWMKEVLDRYCTGEEFKRDFADFVNRVQQSGHSMCSPFYDLETDEILGMFKWCSIDGIGYFFVTFYDSLFEVHEGFQKQVYQTHILWSETTHPASASYLVLRNNGAADRDSMLIEASVLALMQEQNPAIRTCVATYVDVYVSQEGVEYTVEAFDGDLFDYIRTYGGLLQDHTDEVVQKKLKIARDILSALAEIHKAGVVHGDVKCENIIFRENEETLEIRFCDFGFSAPIGRSVNFCGTRPFIPPDVSERLLAHDQYMVERVTNDIWCVGLVLWALFRGSVSKEDGGMSSLWRQQSGQTSLIDVAYRTADACQIFARDYPQYGSALVGLMQIDPENRLPLGRAIFEIERALETVT